jgi:predicted ATPase/DNA-binding CsgD family transcriptional regulator
VTTVGLAKGPEVTAREAEVLALLSRHLTNVQIADALCISVRTVESHVSALLRKLELPDRRSLARYHDAEEVTRVRAGRSTLPTPVTPFIGRAAERAALTAALAEHRMVTATGPGGVGKTRLAISVAAGVAPMRRDGAWFVDLVHVTDPAMVIAKVAETVGVPEQRAASIDIALVASLAERDGLLVIDNCEHLLDGVRECIERILDGCPEVTVLATSRSRLLVPYEWVYAVPGLSVTDSGGDAVALFATRIAAATGGRERLDPRRVAGLCRALDGIALAIELAAARYSTLGLDGLEAGLDERLRFLTAGTRVADRHRSLRHAIGWSYDLLAPDDQALLRGIAVFASWFDVDAAHAVARPRCERAAAADGLARLGDQSLLVVERGEPTRYRALETIRQYGVEQLEAAGELAAVRARHEQWCCTMTTALAAAEPDDAWCAQFDSVVDDIRAALVCSGGDERCRAQPAQLAADLAGLLFVRGRPMEAQRRYEQAATLAPTAAERAGHLRLAAGAAATRYVGNDALRLLRAAADTAIEVGDRATAALNLAWMSIYIDRSPTMMADKPTPDDAAAVRDEARAISDGSARAEAAIALAIVTPTTAVRALDGRNRDPAVLEPARRAVDLAQQTGDATLESAALDELTAAHLALDDIPEAARVVHRRGEVIGALAVVASNGRELLDCHLMAADVSLAAGDLVAAGDHADALARLPFFRDEDHLALSRRLLVDALAGRFDDVARGGERFRLGWERAGRPTASDLACAANAVAMVHGMLGDDERRTEWRHITVDLGVAPERLAGCATGWGATFDALLTLERDDPGAAMARLSADLDDPQVWGFWNTGLWRPWYAALWAEAAVLADHPDATSRIERSRHAARDNPIATAIVARAAAIAAGDHDALVRSVSTFARLGCPYQQARTGTITAGLR